MRGDLSCGEDDKMITFLLEMGDFRVIFVFWRVFASFCGFWVILGIVFMVISLLRAFRGCLSDFSQNLGRRKV